MPQIVTHSRLLGFLHDTSNSTTLAHYLDLLAEARLLTGMKKHRTEPVIARRGSPKLQVFNTALASVLSDLTFSEVRASWQLRGRLTGSAVNAHLANAMAQGKCKLTYWRDNRRRREVDFVVKPGPDLLAIEMQDGSMPWHFSGLGSFSPRTRGRAGVGRWRRRGPGGSFCRRLSGSSCEVPTGGRKINGV